MPLNIPTMADMAAERVGKSFWKGTPTVLAKKERKKSREEQERTEGSTLGTHLAMLGGLDYVTSNYNRATQAVFRCLACGHQAHADINAARNILRAGLALRDAQKAT